MQLNVGDAKVVNSRYFKGQNVVWRRRKTADGTIFTTRERVDLSGKVVTKKTSRATESYQPAKLLISLSNALSHRNDALEASWALLTTVQNRIVEMLGSSQELTTDMIATAVLEVLKAFDIDGFVAYARHHPELVSKDDLIKAIKN